MTLQTPALQSLRRGVAIPAMPLALNAQRKLDERRQRALCRYYIAAGAGGIAAAVHTTQFAIRDPKIALFKPVLELVAEEFQRASAPSSPSPGTPGEGRGEGSSIRAPHILIGGVCGDTKQATAEARTLRDLNYHAALLSLAALEDATEGQLIDHCRTIADTIPLVGFYLQPAVGGRPLPYSFWRRFAEIPNVVAIKMAPFNRYQTLDVVRAIAESGRDDIALYTGNDDNIVVDLLTPYRFRLSTGRTVERRIVGGLLGHYAVWTKNNVDILYRCQQAPLATDNSQLATLLSLNAEVTDANAAFFDAANHFRGCIAGLHEILRRQGLFEGAWCLDEHETLSPGQSEELTRVTQAYPHLCDDAFVAERRDQWLRG